MRLHAERSGSGRRVVLVHGFTQNRRCWGALTGGLATDHEVVLVDAPGHGRSAGVQADLAAGADLLAEAAGAGTYLGYSMGGRLCLHAAVRHPAIVHGLVLLGATPGIEDPVERAQRRGQDRARAARLRADGLHAFLDEWLAQPLFVSLPPDRAHRDARLENTVDGLASSLELAGTGSQEPLWDALPGIGVPVLLVAGERDDRYAALAERMAGAIGDNAATALVPGAGHAAHLEQPAAFLAIVRAWLDRNGL